jgi:hypothetical protein
MTGGQCSLAGGNDGSRCGEVRLADLQMDHVMTLRLQFIGPGQ